MRKKGNPIKQGIGVLEAVLTNKQSPIDIKEIAYQFMHQVGGPSGFVQRIMEEYDGAPIGSLARSRILDIMVRLFQIATPKEKHGELGHLSDEDLASILREQLGKNEKSDGWIDHTCI